MLRIIASSTYNEEFVCKEMKISTSLFEALSTMKPVEINEKVSQSFKDDKRPDKMVYDKLLFIASLVIQSNKLQSNQEKARKFLTNIIEAASYLKDIAGITAFDDILSLLSSSQDDLKEHLFTVLYSKELNEKEKKVIQLFLSFYSPSASDKAIDDFVKYVHSKHCYSVLSQFQFPSCLGSRLASTMSSACALRLLFYITFSSDEVLKCNRAELKQKMLQHPSEFKVEVQLIDLIEKGDYSALMQYDFNALLSAIYNEKGAELISLHAQLALFHSIITASTKSKAEISFKELEAVTKSSFDLIEDVLTEGHIKGFFKVKINYETEMVNVFYVKKLSYSKEDISQLIKEIASMRGKFALVSKSISLI